MDNMILNIDSENYDYDMIDSIYKKLSKRITDVELNFKNDISDKSKIIEGSFILKSNSYTMNIEIIFFLHLLIISYFIELERSEDEDEDLYKNILRSYINESKEYHGNEKKKISDLYFENENKKEIYDVFIDILEISENIFISLTDSLKKKLRKEILNKSISKFNSSNRELNSILRERNQIDIKLKKCYVEIEKIFEIDIMPIFEEYYLDELDNVIYLLKILQDSIKAICTCLIIEKVKVKDSIKVFFNDNSWFIYFYSFLLSSYSENKINLLKLNKNIDFLKFGANTKTINKVFENFIIENNLENVRKELKSEIFYLFLGMGYHDKVVYDIDILDKSNKFEVNLVDKNGDNIFSKGLKIYKLNMNFVIPNFVNMLLSSESNNLKKYINRFIEKINNIKTHIDDNNEEEIIDLEVYISDIFKNLEQDMLGKYNEIKLLYNSSSKHQKIYMIKEFINIFVNRSNIKINSKKNMIKNYDIMLKTFKNHMNYEIKLNRDLKLENNVTITHNLLDPLRLDDEKKMFEILEDELNLAKEFVNTNSLITHEKDLFKTHKNELIEKYKNHKEKSKITIKISTSLDINQEENINLIINMKIFFFLITYNKIRNNNYFLSLNEKLKEIYFNAMVDILYLLNLKDNFLLQNLSVIKEHDYLEYLFEKTESYFLSLYLNSEENMKKINLEVIVEAKEMLNIFKNALIDGYLYYEENNFEFEDKMEFYNEIKENKDISIDSRDKMDTLIENLNLDEFFI